MSNQIYQVKKNLINSNFHNKYIFVDDRTKFIYDDKSQNNIIGMSMLIKNKIVEILDEIFTEEKRIVLLKYNEDELGWVHIDEFSLIRLFRLPKINGKIKDNTNNGIREDDKINQLMDKIVKAYYYFEQDNEKYLFVGRIDGKNMVSIKIEFFDRLIYPEDSMYIHLNKGTSLYNTSNYQTKLNEIQVDKDYEIIAYFNGTNQVRVKIGDEKYWVTKNSEMEALKDLSFDLNLLDVIDFVTYLYESNKYYEGRVRVLNNQLNKISKNIVYNDSDDNLHFKKYLGESYDS